MHKINYKEVATLGIKPNKKIRVPRFARGTVFGLDLDEMTSFFEAIDKSSETNGSNPQRDFLMFKMIFFHGLRRQEAANLEIKDLDFNKKHIFIAAVKNGRSGWELMHPLEKDLLTDYLKIRKDDGSKFVFCSQKKNSPGISVSQISRLYKIYAQKAGLPPEKCHVHCLRHTCAFHMVEIGFSLEDVMIGLRQKSLNSAKVYFDKSPFARQRVQKIFFDGVS